MFYSKNHLKKNSLKSFFLNNKHQMYKDKIKTYKSKNKAKKGFKKKDKV